MRYDTVNIIRPERRTVSNQQITTWFADAVANGEIDPRYFGARNTWERAEALADAGLITIANL